MDPTFPVFPFFALLGCVLSLIPLPWHLQAWNSGTCFYMIWASLACLNQFVNSIVWHGNAINIAPIWCDISIRIMMGASVGFPASSLCIQRRLYHITTARCVSISREQKIRAVLIDSAICVVFPLVFIAMQYIVQGHRFDILEDIGCYPALYNTLLTYFISGMWPVVIGLISAVYCILSLRSFMRRRTEFSQFVSSNRSLTVGRYFRLMALAATEALFTTPQAIFMMWLNASATTVGPWRSWADTHFAFSRVDEFPALIWHQNHLLSLAIELSRWLTIVCALVFFIFFGFAEEARKNYCKTFWWLAKPFGLRPRPVAAKACSIPTIGQYKPKPVSMTTSPSSPSYSPPPSFAEDTKHAKFFTGSLDASTDESNVTSTRVSITPSPHIWPIALHSDPSLSDCHDHDPISEYPVVGSIV